MPGGVERVAQRADDKTANEGGVAKADLGLGGVDIDVDLGRRAVDEQRDDRVAVARQHVLIGAAHRADQQPVAHRPAVDHEVLVARQPAIERRQADPAGQPEAVALGVDRQRILGEIAAEQRRQPGAARVIPTGQAHGLKPHGNRRGLDRQAQQHPIVVADHGKADAGIGHRQPFHRLDRLVALAARRLHEFEARRRREKQVAHLDPRTGRVSGRDRRMLVAGLDANLPGRIGPGGPRDDAQAADRADRRQRLAAKPERGDLQQIVVGQLRGAVALDRQRQLVGSHAAAVIGDRDQRLAAILEGDLDAVGAGIDRVLDQFLDRRRRALDDLARGDAVDENGRQLADRHQVAVYAMPVPGGATFSPGAG